MSDTRGAPAGAPASFPADDELVEQVWTYARQQDPPMLWGAAARALVLLGLIAAGMAKPEGASERDGT